MRNPSYKANRGILICGLIVAVLFLGADFFEKWRNSEEVLISTDAYEAIPFSEFEIERMLMYTETDSLNWNTKDQKDIDCIMRFF